MSATKTRFIENETLLQVIVHTPAMWAGLSPQMHVVSYPNGRTFALTEDLLNFHFTIIRPQKVVFTAHGADGSDRPTSKQAEAERGDRNVPLVQVSEVMAAPPVEDALVRARRLAAVGG